MTFDAHANLAYSTIAGAPGTAGDQLEVAAGTQTLFATPPFNMICWPPEIQPTAENSEIVRVTSINGILFTVTRQQEGSAAQNIEVGWQCAAGPTVKTFTDIETAIAAETTRAEAAESLLAPLASPVFTGTPAAPTAAPGDNSTKLATTAFVTAAIGANIDGGNFASSGTGHYDGGSL